MLLCMLYRRTPPVIALQAFNAVRVFGVLYWHGNDDGALPQVMAEHADIQASLSGRRRDFGSFRARA